MGEEHSCPVLDVGEMLQAQTLVYHYVSKHCGTMSIVCALKLHIPDTIYRLGGGSRPISLADLTAALPQGIHPSKLPSLSGLMRLLVQLGFLAMEGDDGYVLTPFSKILMKANPTGMADLFLGLLHPILLSPWEYLSEWFKGDVPTAFELAHGRNIWEFLGQNPALGAIFNTAMLSNTNSLMSIAVRECADVFQGIGSLVDVGGGTGTAAATIAKAFPGVKCTVLDLPHVVAAAKADGRCEQVEFIAGDMFKHVPSADAIFLQHVLHNWNDKDCLKILRRCKDAIESSEGKLIVLEVILNRSDGDRKVEEAKLFMDGIMVLLHAGKERDEQQWRMLFTEAGFSGLEIKHDIGTRSLMVVYP